MLSRLLGVRILRREVLRAQLFAILLPLQVPRHRHDRAKLRRVGSRRVKPLIVHVPEPPPRLGVLAKQPERLVHLSALVAAGQEAHPHVPAQDLAAHLLVKVPRELFVAVVGRDGRVRVDIARAPSPPALLRLDGRRRVRGGVVVVVGRPVLVVVASCVAVLAVVVRVPVLEVAVVVDEPRRSLAAGPGGRAAGGRFTGVGVR